MSELCNIPSFTPSTTICDYVPQAIKTVKAKKDENGNYFVMINDDGKWRGAELNEDKNGLIFSY